MVDTNLAQKTGWLIAMSRVLIAALIALMAVTSPTDNSLHIHLNEADDAWAFGYLAFSIGVLILFHSSWILSWRLHRAVMAIDIIYYIGIMLFIEPMQSGYFAATFAMLAFLVLSANLQTGYRVGLAILVGANLLCIMMIAQMHFGGMAYDDYQLLRRQAYLLTLSLFLALTSLRFQNVAIARGAIVVGGDQADQMRSSLNFAMTQLAATSGAICWVYPGQSSCKTVVSGNLRNDCASGDSCSGSFPHSVDGPTMFDIKHRFALTISKSGNLVRFPSDRMDMEFIERFKVQTGIFIPLASAAGRGRILLTDIAFQAFEQLFLAKAVGAELQQHFDEVGYHRAIEELALMQLRQSVARDLHDSVAQSLAGVRYWLKSLRPSLSETGPGVDRIDEISASLEEEQASIREMIDRLKSGDQPVGDIDLMAPIKSVADSLRGLWRVQIAIHSSEQEILIDQSLAYEVLQLLRESVANAVKHGGADAIGVVLKPGGDLFELQICDNGSGFRSSDLADKPWSLAQRVRDLGGTIELDSQPGHTEITVRLPQSGKQDG